MFSLGLGYINIISLGLYYFFLLSVSLVLIIFFYYIFVIKLNWFNNTGNILKIVEKFFYFIQVVFSGSFFFYSVIMGYNFEKLYYPLTYIYLRRETSLMYVGFSYRALKSKEKPISECTKIAPIQINNTKAMLPVALEDFRIKDFS